MSKKTQINNTLAADPTTIRKRASEIWQRKCKALNTELDDWLQAEEELRNKLGLDQAKASEYPVEQMNEIRSRARALRLEKINSLHTAFDDWIEAEKELKEELAGKVNIKELFDRWFTKVSATIAEAFKTDAETSSEDAYNIMGKQYVDLMAEVMR